MNRSAPIQARMVMGDGSTYIWSGESYVLEAPPPPARPDQIYGQGVYHAAPQPY